MANAQWCTIEDFKEQVPEMLNDIEVGIISGVVIERYIERATNKIKHQLHHRYDLSQFLSTPATIPLSLRTYVAVDAGLLAIQGRQIGEAGIKREAELKEQSYFWRRLAANGSLLDDTDIPIKTAESTLLGDPSNTPEALEVVFSYGARYGVLDDALATSLQGNTP